MNKSIRGYVALELIENHSIDDLEPIGLFPVYSSFNAAKEEFPDSQIIPIEILESDEVTQH